MDVAAEDDFGVYEHLFDEIRTEWCASLRVDVVARAAAARQAGGRACARGPHVCGSGHSDGRVGVVAAGDSPHVSTGVEGGRDSSGDARDVRARVLSRVRRSALHV